MKSSAETGARFAPPHLPPFQPKCPIGPAVLLAALLLASSAWAQYQYWIAPNGNDGADGSSNAPWKTMSRAITTNTSSQVTVFMRSGKYINQGATNAGRAAMITFMPSSGELVTNAFRFLQVTNVRVERMRLEASRFLKCRSIQVVSNDFTSADGGALTACAITDCLVQGNYFHDINPYNNSPGDGFVIRRFYPDPPVGGSSTWNSNVTILYNTFTNIWDGDGMQLTQLGDFLIASNLFVDIYVGATTNHCDGVQLQNSANGLVRDNTFLPGPHGYTRAILALPARDANGQYENFSLTNLTFINNLAAGYDFGIRLRSCPGAVLANNTLWGLQSTANSCLDIEDSRNTNLVLVNNIARAFTTPTAALSYADRRNNLFDNLYGNTSLFPGETNATPTFVSSSTANFHLATSSVGRNLGVTNFAAFPAYDHDGVLRDPTPDLGAFETVAETPVVTNSATSSEPFDNADSVAAHGWAGYGNTSFGNNFAFSTSNNTGLSPGGEAGGVLTRATNVCYYGDTNLGRVFTLADRLHCDGELAITGKSSGYDSATAIGFFLSSNGGETKRKCVLGLTIAEPLSGFTYRVRPSVTPAVGKTMEPSAYISLVNGNAQYRFNADYDPAGGLSSTGRVTVQIFDTADNSLGVLSQDLYPSNRTAGATFDSFGLITGGIGQGGTNAPNDWLALFIDLVTYSSATNASGFSTWKLAQFGTNASNPAVGGDLADPDNDGLSNLLEYGLGLNPSHADAPKPITSRTDTGFLSMAYTRPSPPPTDLTYSHEAGGTLESWSPAASIQVHTNGDGTETVTVTDSVPTHLASERFLRLKVSLN